MGNFWALFSENEVSPMTTTSPSEPTPSEREEQLRYLRIVRILPRLQRRKRQSVIPPVYNENGRVINSDDRVWVYWRPPHEGEPAQNVAQE